MAELTVIQKLEAAINALLDAQQTTNESLQQIVDQQNEIIEKLTNLNLNDEGYRTYEY